MHGDNLNISVSKLGRCPLSSVQPNFPILSSNFWMTILGITAKKFQSTRSLFFSDVFIGVTVVGS